MIQSLWSSPLINNFSLLFSNKSITISDATVRCVSELTARMAALFTRVSDCHWEPQELSERQLDIAGPHHTHNTGTHPAAGLFGPGKQRGFHQHNPEFHKGFMEFSLLNTWDCKAMTSAVAGATEEGIPGARSQTAVCGARARNQALWCFQPNIEKHSTSLKSAEVLDWGQCGFNKVSKAGTDSEYLAYQQIPCLYIFLKLALNWLYIVIILSLYCPHIVFIIKTI